jgi:hypothetical protein
LSNKYWIWKGESKITKRVSYCYLFWLSAVIRP